MNIEEAAEKYAANYIDDDKEAEFIRVMSSDAAEQYIEQFKAEQKQSGVWVKASERLPEYGNVVKIKWYAKEYMCKVEAYAIFADLRGINTFKLKGSMVNFYDNNSKDFENIEWLETPQKQLQNGMKNIPEKIYLQIGFEPDGCDDFTKLHDVSWCADKVFDSDIEYVLNLSADTPATPSAASQAGELRR